MMSSQKLVSPSAKRPWLMKVKPLALREKLFWKLYFNKSTAFTSLFQAATLEFAPQISLSLMPSDVSHQQIAFQGFTELLVSRRIAELAKGSGLMVDVGANSGYYSCLWAAADVKNRVVAYEASPKNFSSLINNLISNQIESQVDVHKIAVGRENGTSLFTLGSDEQTGWGGLSIRNQDDAIKVPVITLDEFFLKREDERIQVLKIDTEGADTWVLQGAKHLLRLHKINHIFFEQNTSRMSALGIKPGVAQNLLQDCGYSLEKIGTDEFYAKIT